MEVISSMLLPWKRTVSAHTVTPGTHISAPFVSMLPSFLDILPHDLYIFSCFFLEYSSLYYTHPISLLSVTSPSLPNMVTLAVLQLAVSFRSCPSFPLNRKHWRGLLMSDV